MFSAYIKERMSGTRLFKWEPNVDLLVAIITLLLMWVSYYGGVHWYGSNLAASLIIFIVATNILLNVVFPVWWVVIRKKQPLSELGITKKFLLLSISISILLALWRGVNLPELIQGADWVPILIFGAFNLFEPFFVFGWLQTRYEKSFGVIPAIVLAASSFVLFQIGSAPLDGLAAIFFVYLVLATAFGITKNIFTLWPIYWCVGSVVNILSLKMRYGWDMVAAYSIALIIQLGFIFYIYKKQSKIAKTS